MITTTALELWGDQYEREAEKLEQRGERYRDDRMQLVRLAEVASEKASEVGEVLDQTIEADQDFSPEDDEIDRLIGLKGRLESLSREFEDRAEQATSPESIETGGEGFYGDIHCDLFTFEEPLRETVQNIKAGFLNGLPIDATLSTRGWRTQSLFETAPTSVNNSRLIFFFRDCHSSRWTEEVGSVCVGVEGDELLFWGPLAEPLKTNDPQEMAAHLEEEVVAARERFDVVCELEKLGSRDPLRRDISECSYQELVDNHQMGGAIRVSGVGYKSIGRMAEIYGSPSNVLCESQSDVKGVSTAYGRDSDTEKVYWQCVEAVRRFRRFSKEGEIDCERSLEELAEFPKTPVYNRARWATPHTALPVDR